MQMECCVSSLMLSYYFIICPGTRHHEIVTMKCKLFVTTPLIAQIAWLVIGTEHTLGNSSSLALTR